MKLKLNFDYCEDHREYFVNNPSFIFTENNFYTNNFNYSKFRHEVIPKIGKDITPRTARSNGSYVIDLPVNTNIFWTWDLFFYNRQIGKQYSCLTQASNHIPGHDSLYRKDLVGQAAMDYAKGYKERPQCFSFDRYFPKTWRLQDKEQCEEFFAEFLSEKYQELKQERTIVYFRKIGADVHEGRGVFPVNDLEERKIQNWYKNGTLCGKIKMNNLIQYNVHNFLLVDSRKFHFRSYLLLASANPFIAYYHDGYARLSLNKYSQDSNDTSTFVTNIGVNLLNDEYKDWTEEQIQDYTYWSFERFADYMYEIGATDDPKWLENYLRPQFMKIKIHLLRMASKGFFRKSTVFELYGMDFMMDEKLNLWFIEANTMPLLNGFNKHSTELMNQMMIDTVEIVQGLIKSRTKRIIQYINLLINSEGGELGNLEERREEFILLTQNRFEEEFEPSPKNSFFKIVDENLPLEERYFGLLDRECLQV